MNTAGSCLKLPVQGGMRMETTATTHACAQNPRIEEPSASCHYPDSTKSKKIRAFAEKVYVTELPIL